MRRVTKLSTNPIVKTLTGREYEAKELNMRLYLGELKNMFLTIFSSSTNKKDEKLIKGVNYLRETSTEWPLKLDVIHLPYKNMTFFRNDLLSYMNEKNPLIIQTTKDKSIVPIEAVYEIETLERLQKNINESIYYFSPLEEIPVESNYILVKHNVIYFLKM